MGDGQRSEDLIPFTSKGRPAGKPPEGGAELAIAILGDPQSQVKQSASRMEWLDELLADKQQDQPG
jgi:hypothetical protein